MLSQDPLSHPRNLLISIPHKLSQHLRQPELPLPIVLQIPQYLFFVLLHEPFVDGLDGFEGREGQLGALEVAEAVGEDVLHAGFQQLAHCH
jgi:hypothetical protein